MYGFHWEFVIKEDLSKIDEITSISDCKLSTNKLCTKLQEIEIMKKLLNKDTQQEYSYEYLKSQIDNFCNEHFEYIAVLISYISEMPEQVKKTAEKIIEAQEDKELYKKLYDEYLEE